MLTREQEVDAAYALEAFPSVVATYVLEDVSGGWPRAASIATTAPNLSVSNPDALLLAVVLRPFSIAVMVEAHYILTAFVDREVSGRVLYVNGDDHPPPLLSRHGRRLSLTSGERSAATLRAADALRAQKRDYEYEAERARELERDGMAAAMAARFGALDSPVAISLDSGEFEIFRDPFPAPMDRQPRLLLVDADLQEAVALRMIDGIEIVHTSESWEALEHLVYGDFDLALCALRVGDMTGAHLYRLVAKQRPYMAARIVFMAAPESLQGAPPSTALARVLSRPVAVESVRALLEQWRQREPSSSTGP